MDPVITKEKPGGLPEHEREGRPHPGRAIVTYGRSLMSLVIARSLDEQGVEVIGCDDVAMTVLSFSRHVEQTFTHASLDDDPEQALKDIEAAVRKYAPEDDRPYVLIPAFRDAKLFAEHRDRFEPLIKVAAPDFSSIEKVHPKDVFADFVEDAGVPAPATKVLPAGDRDIEALGELTFPLIAKPNDGVGGRGVEKIDDEAELRDYLSRARAKDAILLQEVVEGKDYCVSFVAVQGQLVGVVAYHNLTQFPREAGAGASRETVDAAPFRAATEKLVRATKWNGVAEIDFRWDGNPDSEPKVIEINPRYWAGLFHRRRRAWISMDRVSHCCRAAGAPCGRSGCEGGFPIAHPARGSCLRRRKWRPRTSTCRNRRLPGRKRASGSRRARCWARWRS